jgi:hypothetical protein
MRWQSVALLLMVIVPVLGIVGAVRAGERIVVGGSEEVLLLPWGVKLPARIDTGSAICSLDARELEVKDNVAQFKLPDAYGGLQLRLPVVRWRHVRSSNARQRRPVVLLEIRLGPKLLRVEANLTNRSQLKYPLLIGLNVLRQGFMVDVTKSNIAPPAITPKVEAR